jgi:D-alanyl-D-alanine carboxypeptidase (penicillin-binding protein 5/6)
VNRLRLVVSGFLIFLLIAASIQFLRPLPKLAPTLETIPPIAAQIVNVPWPTYGQGAVSEETYGPLSSSGEQKAAPMASTAKMVTAMTVLKQKPLSKGEQGPTITLTDADVTIYNSYLAKQGSVVKVVSGEQISEYQALQAVLIASANNMADSLAIWAFGSIDAYVSNANLLISQLRADNTKVDGASGFSSGSVSTAEDLVKLGETLMQHAVAAEIVNQKEAVIPVAGKITNYNSLLGVDGVVGIKTGNTDEAGGCFVWASKKTVLGQEMNFVGAVMGAPTRQQAIADSDSVNRSLDQNFMKVTIVKKDQVVGHYASPWDTSTDIVAKDDLSFIAWKGKKLTPALDAQTISANTKAGTEIGKALVPLGKHVAQEPLVLKNDIPRAPWTWRLLR